MSSATLSREKLLFYFFLLSLKLSLAFAFVINVFQGILKDHIDS